MAEEARDERQGCRTGHGKRQWSGPKSSGRWRRGSCRTKARWGTVEWRTAGDNRSREGVRRVEKGQVILGGGESLGC